MKIIDLFFPQFNKCIFCHKETSESNICKSCYSKLPFINGKTCDKCGGAMNDDGLCGDCKKIRHEFLKCYCIFDYDKEIQEKLIAFKQNKRKNIGEGFSYIVKEYFSKIKMKFDLVIPVPIHENRLKERKFNQSEILASKISIANSEIMKRVKDTPHQTGLSRKNRENNLTSAFEILDKRKVKGKVILLVDDIYTTGATLDECARCLYNVGAKAVYGLCLARGKITH